MKVEIAYGTLTYREVRMILALLDGWPRGSIHFEAGMLVVDAITDARDSAVATEVTSPGVGIFRAQAVATGGCIGHIDAPLKSTPVLVPENARIVANLVKDGAFVEYGQPLVVVTQ